jgi:murein DD-endopeptidase MepM/ murein hydrolase activator NlpD
MRRWCVRAAIISLWAMTVLPVSHSQPLPTPEIEVTQGGVSLHVFNSTLRQGRAGLIAVTAASMPQGEFLDQTLTFFQVDGDTNWYALLVAPLSLPPKSYPLEVQADGETLSASVQVTNGGFIQQNVIIVSDMGGLFDRTVEDAELARITTTASVITPIVYWLGRGFGHPIETTLTSPFGALRTFNGLYETIHTGWDYNAPIGRPLVASAPGRVAFAGYEAIRGNYVLIDHGYGIFSGYAHLSVVYVTQGQLVDRGQVVGLVGSTGRSSSAHAHFEMLVNSQWIDSTDFINSLPLPR